MLAQRFPCPMPSRSTDHVGLVDRASGLRVPLRSVSVSSVVDDVVSTHTITQRFENPRDAPLEVVYTFPVEDGAVISGMTVRATRACREWGGRARGRRGRECGEEAVATTTTTLDGGTDITTLCSLCARGRAGRGRRQAPQGHREEAQGGA